ncbi:MAG: hypothetical protein JWM64_462 [Frankiales bacterium]|nr:hypothetical protein [Frankiales bacterium]
MSTTIAAVLAGLLVLGTGVGLVSAVNSSSTDRVPDSTSTAPVYGAQ